MIEVEQQRDLILRMIESLEAQLKADPLPGAPANLVSAHRAITRQQIGQLSAELAEMFQGCEELATDWLNSPQPIFCGLTPLQHASEFGAEDVLDLIGRLRNGVFS